MAGDNSYDESVAHKGIGLLAVNPTCVQKRSQVNRKKEEEEGERAIDKMGLCTS